MNASAPASSANLGPGFDSLALALELRCRVDVAEAASWEIANDPEGFVQAAATRISQDPLRIEVRSEIPVGKGLGSSAALLAALETAVRRLWGNPVEHAEVFDAVAAAEGHADNAAAAVYGGLVLAGSGSVHRMEMHPSLSVVVAVPNQTLPTGQARAALPEAVPFEAAARTSGRAIRLVEGLRTGNLEVLGSIGPDEMHEPFRVALRPVIGRLLSAAAEAGAPFAAISGAGPSVLAIVTEQSREAVTEALGDAVGEGTLLSPAIAAEGVL